MWGMLVLSGLVLSSSSSETPQETCARIAQETKSNESMEGMDCYSTQAEAIHIAVSMCCNGSCCAGAHQMSASCPWAPGATHESCSSANILALSLAEAAEPAAAAAAVDCGKLYGMYDRKQEAEAAAATMGCGSDSHMMGDMWMPGTSMDAGCGECSGALAGHSMAMAFALSNRAGEILFNSWTGDTAGRYWGSIVAVFLLGWSYEALKHKGRTSAIRWVLTIDATVAQDGKLYHTDTGVAVTLGRFTLPHLVDAFMYGIQLVLGYLLMLIAMVYNVGLFVAVVLGAAVGYFCFAPPNDGKKHLGDDNGCCD